MNLERAALVKRKFSVGGISRGKKIYIFLIKNKTTSSSCNEKGSCLLAFLIRILMKK